MNKHLNDPAAKFIVYKDIKPLVKKDSPGEILFLSREQVGDRVGTDFAEAPSGAEKDVAKLHESARIPYTLPALVFLGIDDRSSPTTNESSKVDHLNPTGTPYFALDAGMNDWEDLLAEVGGEWGDARASAASMSNWDAGVFAQGRALVDWNTRNKFCPACGTATYSLWAGWKRNCTSAIHPVEGKEPCFSTKGLHNFAYPRTDPVIIMGILDSTGDKILLGRQKSWPKGMYSCLAGFIEPGESFEDAVRREVLEEAGIEVGPVRYSSSQPWPYPSNLMVGCFGRAKDGQTIRLDLDNELEDAQWFPRSVISSIVSSPTGSAYTKSDLNKLDEKTQTQTQSQSQVKSHADKDAESSAALAPSEKTAEEISDIQKKQGDGLGITRVPPDTAIAGQLVRLWVKGGLDLVSKL
ncbi:NAD+ diphosphatase [Kwoniella heveanensis CBS 569]|nr:NAD+ diphosphatase [Kwoniella heveanensis CBS 569]